MIVVSWTGDEVECYHGRNLASNVVTEGFKLPSQSVSVFPRFLNTPDPGATARKVTRVVITVLAMVMAFAFYASCRGQRRTATMLRSSAPANLLHVGDTGRLFGQDYLVTSDTKVDVAEVGVISECREYSLSSHAGEETALLLGGFAGDKKWHLFSPVFTARPLSPSQAGRLQVGQSLDLEGDLLVVERLFQATVRQVDGSATPNPAVGDRWYGFTARSSSILFLARWNERKIDYYKGKTLDASELRKAFTLR
jgi:hypothetical protein